VLDETLGSEFVPNDVELGDEAAGAAARLALITGPNMAGKSTFIRQTALITLLAHTGSFVPADRATVGITDRIFTRIGADDALHAGQSTFMVEMIETANILNHFSARSLVVLDEVGRGTSTLDGLSLAWAIAEHLARPASGEPGPRTLFATHYHELTDLEERLAGSVRNLHVAVREWPAGDGHAEIVFLHRILPGRTDQSYGLHVARLAGMPAPVVARGREVLASLAVHHSMGQAAPGAASIPEARPARGAKPEPSGQLSLFTEYVEHPAVGVLRETKLDSMSPLQAFDALRKLKELVDA
jgi:DNA mismatch repair protein MutS